MIGMGMNQGIFLVLVPRVGNEDEENACSMWPLRDQNRSWLLPIPMNHNRAKAQRQVHSLLYAKGCKTHWKSM